MNIGPPIDWAATGAMLSGWGTLLGVVAVIYAAKVGADKFGEWKRQRIEARKMEFAEELLVALYRYERSIGYVRSPFHTAVELEQAAEKLRSQVPNFENQTDDLKSRQKTAQVVFDRIAKERPVFEAVSDLLPLTKALFPDLGEHQEALWRQVHRVQISAQGYAQHGVLSAEREERLGHDIWALEDENDQVHIAVSVAKEAIEARLLPVINEAIDGGN